MGGWAELCVGVQLVLVRKALALATILNRTLVRRTPVVLLLSFGVQTMFVFCYAKV